MRKAIHAALAVLGLSLATSVLVPAAHANSQYPSYTYEGNNN